MTMCIHKMDEALRGVIGFHAGLISSFMAVSCFGFLQIANAVAGEDSTSSSLSSSAASSRANTPKVRPEFVTFFPPVLS